VDVKKQWKLRLGAVLLRAETDHESHPLMNTSCQARVLSEKSNQGRREEEELRRGATAEDTTSVVDWCGRMVLLDGQQSTSNELGNKKNFG